MLSTEVRACRIVLFFLCGEKKKKHFCTVYIEKKERKCRIHVHKTTEQATNYMRMELSNGEGGCYDGNGSDGLNTTVHLLVPRYGPSQCLPHQSIFAGDMSWVKYLNKTFSLVLKQWKSLSAICSFFSSLGKCLSRTSTSGLSTNL